MRIQVFGSVFNKKDENTTIIRMEKSAGFLIPPNVDFLTIMTFKKYYLVTKVTHAAAGSHQNDMTEAENFFYNYQGKQQLLMLKLHHLLTEECNLVAKMRYQLPFYYGKTWICYLQPKKDETVELAFVRGNELFNQNGLLNHFGRKQVSSVLLTPTTQIPWSEVEQTIHEAILLDRVKPYSSKRKTS